MTVNINSAFRIREILQAVKKVNDNEKIINVWARVFEIEEKDEHKRSALIARILADLHDEVEHIRSEMIRLDYSPSLYSSTFKKLNNLFGVHLLMGQWSQTKQFITQEVPFVIGFCCEILPDEERDIDISDLNELKALTKELRSSLEKSDLPAHIRSVIEKHLAKLEEALSTYAAVGVKALEEALQSAYGEVITNEAVFEDARGSEEISMLSQLWKKTKVVIDGVTTVNRGLGSAEGIAEKGRQLIEYIQNL